MKTFKILSIDGGGIKGLYSATVLQELEKKYGKLNNYFDLICGTSTGGIIALAISVGIPLPEICLLYKEYGKEIFPPNIFFKIFRLCKKLVLYNRTNLDKKLEVIFGEKLLDDGKCCLCIPSINSAENLQPTIFKTSHHKSLIRDKKRTMLDVARSTSAAPVYFNKAKIKGFSDNLTDGGLWLNNPSFSGLIEAMSYFVGETKEYTDIKLLSVGNIKDTKNYPLGHSLVSWVLGANVVKKMIRIQERTFEELIVLFKKHRIFPISAYVRIEKELFGKDISMDCVSKKILETLEKWAKEDIQNEINKKTTDVFFKEHKREWIFPVK